MPNQATNTTTGNWRARYASEFYDAQGRHWRVEVIDHDTTAHAEFGLSSTADPYDVELTDDGFVLSWDGPSDHVGAALIPSSCEITLAIETAAMEPLVSRIKASDDARFGLAVYYDDGGANWNPWWVGTLNHEAIEYETKDRPYLVKLVASCGLQRLRNIEFTDNGSAYLDKYSMAELIAICINKIPTSDFWLSNEHQLFEVVDLYNEDHFTQINQSWALSAGDAFPISVLERTLTQGAAFSKRKNSGREDDFGRRVHYPLNFNSCHEVLESIVNAFGARMMLTRFAWWFFPPNALNWSHTLRAQKWTRSIIESEVLSTGLFSANNVDTSTTEDINFEVDIETNHALGDGWSNSYLLPVKRTTVTFENAGQRSVFGVPRHGYLDYPSAGSGYTNQNVTINEGETLSLRGTYTSGDLRKEFGTGSGAFNDYGTSRIGARIILRLKIKVGSLYYGSEYYVDTPTTSVDMPAGGGGDLSFKRVFVDDPSWSSTEKFFDIIIPWTHSEPPAEVENSQDWVRVGGLHIRQTGTGVFEYVINETQQDDVAHEFDFTTAPLPSTSSSYTGIEVTIDRIVVTCDGVVKQSFPDLANIFHGVGLVNYDYTGSSLPSYSQSAPADRLDEFYCGIGSDSDDADFEIFTEQTSNTEYLDLGKTLLGDNTVGGLAQSNGALSIITHDGTTTNDVLTTGGWESITDAIDDNDEPDELLIALCREHLFLRGSVLGVQRGQIVPKHSTTTNTSAPLDILNVLKHNCSTESDLDEYLVPLRFRMVGGPTRYDVDAFLRARERVSFESDEGRVPRNPTNGSGNGTISPTGSQGSPSTDTSVYFLNGLILNNSDDITAIQAKTDNITITQAVNLDNLESQVGQNTFNIATNTTNISNNTSSITDLATVLKSTTGGGGQGVYTDSGKATTSSYMGLTSTSAKLQAGGGNTAIDLVETSPGQISMAVQVGATGFETSATAIDIQGTTGSQLPDITFNGNISGIDLNDLDDVNASSPSNGEVLTWDSTTSKWTAQTGGSGGGGSMNDLVDDTSPQLGGNLDLNSNNITGTGNINTTGTITTSGLATLPGIALGATGILGTGAIQTTSSLTGQNIAATGTLSVTGNATFNSNLYAQGIQFTGSGTNTIGPSGTGGTQDDLEIQSNGNVTVVLDYDSNEPAQAFTVKNQAGTIIFQVDEDGISSGLFTTTTPTISTIADFESTQTGTITVSNYDSATTYLVKLFDSSNSEVSHTITNNNDGTWTITSGLTVGTGYYVTIQAQKIGEFISASATSNTFECQAAQTQKRYWRLVMTDSSKNPTHNKVALGSFFLFTGSNGSGTVYPNSALTSNTAPSPYVASGGYRYSTTYDYWRAFDAGGNAAGSMWWTLGLSSANAALNYIQIDLGSSINIGSCQIATSGGWTDCNFAVLYGSDTGNFSGEEREMAFFQNIDTAGQSGGTFTTFTENIS